MNVTGWADGTVPPRGDPFSCMRTVPGAPLHKVLQD